MLSLVYFLLFWYFFYFFFISSCWFWFVRVSLYTFISFTGIHCYKISSYTPIRSWSTISKKRAWDLVYLDEFSMHGEFWEIWLVYFRGLGTKEHWKLKFRIGVSEQTIFYCYPLLFYFVEKLKNSFVYKKIYVYNWKLFIS